MHVSEERQKTLDIGSICLLLKIVLGSQFRPQVDSFTQYLQVCVLSSSLVFLGGISIFNPLNIKNTLGPCLVCPIHGTISYDSYPCAVVYPISRFSRYNRIMVEGYILPFFSLYNIGNTKKKKIKKMIFYIQLFYKKIQYK